MKNTYENYRIIIVDNVSTNDSVSYIKRWAEGKLNIWLRKDNPLYDKSFPPSSKPLCYCEYNYSKFKFKRIFGVGNEKIVFINSDKNSGFAGGCNLGIKFLRNCTDGDPVIWFLNPDTVVSIPKGVKIETIEKKTIYGTTVLNYYGKGIQAYGGGTLHSLFGISRHITKIREIDKLDYIYGASLIVRLSSFDELGLFSEKFFMNWEETEFCYRAAKHYNYDLKVLDEIIVWHKEGRSYNNNFQKMKLYYSGMLTFWLDFQKIPRFFLTYFFSFGGLVIYNISRLRFKKVGYLIYIYVKFVFCHVKFK